MRELLSKKANWHWGAEQQAAFDATKEELLQPTVLALYNPKAQTKVSADASSFGLGAVLLQQDDRGWHPVAFASRSLSEVEQRYAQIEKEALATVWACEKFAAYLVGGTFSIETDHKPLVPLLSTKHLDCLPPRVLRFRLRLDRFDYTIYHVPGKELYTADALSRALSSVAGITSQTFQNELEEFVDTITSMLPASSDRLEEYRTAQKADATCSMIRHYCKNGWPHKSRVPDNLKQYCEIQSELSVCNDLLLRNSCIVVPKSLQKQTLEKIHHGHQGIQKCRSRANTAVWWPAMSSQINTMVKSCVECSKHVRVNCEPMISTPLPEYPWQVVGSDLFHHKGTTYLLVVDYFSRYPEISKLSTTTSQGIINALRPIFARHGVPEILRSDNGPQYASQEMTEFSVAYGFQQITSSPHYPKSNGLAERTVQTIKTMLEKSTDPFLALLSHRATALQWCGLSPSELLMGRRIRTTLPQVTQHLIPNWSFLKSFRELDNKYKSVQKRNYDRYHRARPLPELTEDTPVWIRTENSQQSGRIVSASGEPRSYIVSTQSNAESQRSPVQTRSRTGTTMHPPNRLTY